MDGRSTFKVAAVASAIGLAVGGAASSAVAAGTTTGKPDLGRIPGVTTAGTYKYVATNYLTPAASTTWLGTAACPKGTHVTGGGISSSGSTESMNNSYPVDGGDAGSAPDDKWAVYLINLNGSTNVTVYAICHG